MSDTLNFFMNDLIDYAGLFPPAGLDMQAAVDNFAEYRRGPHVRWLGRFVVPAVRLAEFEQASMGKGPKPESVGEAWRVSALIGEDFTGELKLVEAFNDRRAKHDGAERIFVDAIEARITRLDEVRRAVERPSSKLKAYLEFPWQEDPRPWVAAIARAGRRAKIRTGGITPSAFPPPMELARFLCTCAKARLAFKATAGLHHPLRGENRLTYEAASPAAMMHGFINVFLAAAFARDGMAAGEVAELLEEKSPGAISFGAQQVTWRDRRMDSRRLRDVRERFALSFGSCSFQEPVADLRTLGYL